MQKATKLPTTHLSSHSFWHEITWPSHLLTLEASIGGFEFSCLGSPLGSSLVQGLVHNSLSNLGGRFFFQGPITCRWYIFVVNATTSWCDDACMRRTLHSQLISCWLLMPLIKWLQIKVIIFVSGTAASLAQCQPSGQLPTMETQDGHSRKLLKNAT